MALPTHLIAWIPLAWENDCESYHPIGMVWYFSALPLTCLSGNSVARQSAPQTSQRRPSSITLLPYGFRQESA